MTFLRLPTLGLVNVLPHTEIVILSTELLPVVLPLNINVEALFLPSILTEPPITSILPGVTNNPPAVLILVVPLPRK